MRTEKVVLVVEDEVLVRIAALDMLEAGGYRGLEAENADEAIRLLETRSDINLVFTDIQMPGTIDGLSLAKVITNRWPPVRLVVTSAMPRPAELASDTIFLPKPYLWRALDAKIQSALNRI